ncbi:MAG: tetratricopeptide repeat protein [Actinomycetota bacterium]
MRRTVKIGVAAILLLALVACSPPERLREMVGRQPSTPTPQSGADLDYPAPGIPPQPASLSLGALVHTNEASWDGVLSKSVSAGGALVLAVLPDTPAAQAGLERGDVITEIDGTGVTNHEQLVTALRLSADEEHSLAVGKADGTDETIEVQLAQAPQLSLLSHLEQRVAQSPDPAYRFLLADRVLDHGRAIELYRGLVGEFPDFAVAKSLLAKRLISQMESVAGGGAITTLGATPEIEEARALINEAVESDPSAASIYRTRAQIYLSLNENAQAEDDAQTALDMDSGAAQAHFLAGTARLVQGRPEDALAALHRAVELDPFMVQYYFNLALCYRELGMQDEAALTVESAKSLTDDAGTRQSLDEILQSA